MPEKLTRIEFPPRRSLLHEGAEFAGTAYDVSCFQTIDLSRLPAGRVLEGPGIRVRIKWPRGSGSEGPKEQGEARRP